PVASTCRMSAAQSSRVRHARMRVSLAQMRPGTSLHGASIAGRIRRDTRRTCFLMTFPVLLFDGSLSMHSSRANALSDLFKKRDVATFLVGGILDSTRLFALGSTSPKLFHVGLIVFILAELGVVYGFNRLMEARDAVRLPAKLFLVLCFGVCVVGIPMLPT